MASSFGGKMTAERVYLKLQLYCFKKYYIHSLPQKPRSNEFISPFTGDPFIRNMVAQTYVNFSSELVLWDTELST